MSDSEKKIPVRTIALGAIFVFLGFLTAMTFFKYLTRPKQVLAPALSAALRQQAAQIRSTQIAADKQEEPEAEVVEAVREEVQDSIAEEEAEVEIIEREVPILVLNGIFASPTGSYALINNRIVKEDETILGVKVVRIHTNKVELDAFGKKMFLRVK